MEGSLRHLLGNYEFFGLSKETCVQSHDTLTISSLGQTAVSSCLGLLTDSHHLHHFEGSIQLSLLNGTPFNLASNFSRNLPHRSLGHFDCSPVKILSPLEGSHHLSANNSEDSLPTFFRHLACARYSLSDTSRLFNDFEGSSHQSSGRSEHFTNSLLGLFTDPPHIGLSEDTCSFILLVCLIPATSRFLFNSTSLRAQPNSASSLIYLVSAKSIFRRSVA